MVIYFMYESESRSVVSNSLRPYGLYSPWNSLDQNTRVGSLSLLQGIFPTQGSNLGLLHCRQILYQLSHREAEEYQSVQPIPSPGDLPDPGIELGSPALQADSLPTEGSLIFYVQQYVYVNCKLLIYPSHHLFSLVTVNLFLNLLSVLKISSFVSFFFQIPHISEIIRYLPSSI